MRIGVIDVGSNTARLLVADVDGADVMQVAARRAYLGLGEEIARTGTLSDATIRRTASLAGAYALRARSAGVDVLRTMVTAPGRQGIRGAALQRALEQETGAPTRILSADEEGALAFAGVVASTHGPLADVVAVADVGGGSTELTVGAPRSEPGFTASIDLGSLRLARLELDGDPPTKRQLRRARDLVREALQTVEPPAAGIAFATGGSARAAAKIAGPELTREALDEVLALTLRRPAEKLARTFRLHPHRARTVAAGALLLQESVRTLGRPLHVVKAGMREGAVLHYAHVGAAAATAAA